MEGLKKFLELLFRMNIGLFIFNLLPVPPLDGGSIFSSILPDAFGEALDSIGQFGWILLFAAAMTGLLGRFINAILPYAHDLFFFGSGIPYKALT